MKLRFVFGLSVVVLGIILSGCASKSTEIRIKSSKVYDLRHGTDALGAVEFIGKDYIVVRFDLISSHGYGDNNEIRQINLVRLYTCHNASSHYCSYKLGNNVMTSFHGGKKIRDPIDQMLKTLAADAQVDAPLVIIIPNPKLAQ